MSSKKTYIVANWKMNFTPGQASLYLHRLSERILPSRNLQLIIAPSTIALQPLSLQLNRRQFKLAVQNFYHQDIGAYTGETSISQVRSFVDYALVGHSERRNIFHESDKDVRAKVAAAIRNGVTPILCIGETAEERRNNETKSVIHDQLIGGLSDVCLEDIDKVIIAYEPVWAISGHKGAKPAHPADIDDAIILIRQQLARLYGKTIAEAIPVLYGGSVNKDTAAGYLEINGVDGLLIGGASLIADSFCAIVETAKGINKNEQ